MTAEELAWVNDFRGRRGRQPLTESPGIRFLKYDKSKEGYWDYEKFEDQVVALVDAVEELYPNTQIVFEADWSRGHARKQPGGLYITDVGLKVGGKQEDQTPMRDTLITPGCLRSGDKDGSANARLKPWETQHFRFRTGDVVNPYDREKCTLVQENKHVGEKKGLRQVLWERVLWAPGEAVARARTHPVGRLEGDG